MKDIEELKAKLEESLKSHPGHKGRPGKRGGSLIIARSSTQKYGIHVLPGLIDPDYRGEIGIQVQNFSETDVVVDAGARIAQGIVLPVVRVDLEEVEELSQTVRGDLGFGQFSGV